MFLILLFLFASVASSEGLSKNIIRNPEIPDLLIRYPVDTSKIKKISSTFGESRYDHFHNGIDIPGENIPVYPLKKGRLLWFRNKTRRLNEAPFGGGRTIILEHKNFWSGYMHLREINFQLGTWGIIEPETEIGRSGKSGHSGGGHLHFFIYESAKKRIYNPLYFFNENITQDKKPPVLKNYYKINLNPKSTKSHESLFADIKDQGVARERWGIFFLKIFDDKGNLIKNIQFDFIEFKDHHWRTPQGYRFSEIFHGYYYFLSNTTKKTIFWEAGGFQGPSIKGHFQGL